MKRVNAYQFYTLGMVLHPLSKVKEGVKVSSILLELMTSLRELESFKNEKNIQLSVCKPLAIKIQQAIKNIVEPILEEGGEGIDKELDWTQAYNISNGVKEFETVLSAELPSISIYHVSQKGAYSTADLIERAEFVLDEKVRASITPQALVDIQQAGRCIAFECPTAAGFHILRATEAVLREYYGVVVGKPPKAKVRNWGFYIKILKSHSADPKVIAVLDQIRELHRNPIMHPETILEMDETLILLGVAQSAIFAMVQDMNKRRKSTPVVASADLLVSKPIS